MNKQSTIRQEQRKYASEFRGMALDDRHKPVTMADIAEILNVSTATVSRALGGSALVGKQTADKIKMFAQKIGFVINTDGRDLRLRGAHQPDPQDKKVTIYDLALHLNVSVSTVSRCFASRGDVSAKTKLRVMNAAREMGFIFQENARRLRHKRKPVVGIMVSCLHDPQIMDLLKGVEEELTDSGYDLLISNCLTTAGIPATINQKGFFTFIDALIFINCEKTSGKIVIDGFPEYKPIMYLYPDHTEVAAGSTIAEDGSQTGRLAARSVLQKYFSGDIK